MQKTRNSNIELLRIIAMVMILGLHVNFLAIGQPSTQEIVSSPIQSFIRLFAEYACIVGVNVFVLISGWFGIHYKPKGIVQFLLVWNSLQTKRNCTISFSKSIFFTDNLYSFCNNRRSRSRQIEYYVLILALQECILVCLGIYCVVHYGTNAECFY